MFIIRMLKARRMRWTGHVARIRRRGKHIGFWCSSEKERDHWENLGVGSRIVLRWILEK
jgi:hypothetical protein